MHLVLHELLEDELTGHRTNQRHHQNSDQAVCVAGGLSIAHQRQREFVQEELARNRQVVARTSEALGHRLLDAGILDHVEHRACAGLVGLFQQGEVGEEDVGHFMIQKTLDGHAQLFGGVIRQIRQIDGHRTASAVALDVCVNSALSDLDAITGQHLRNLDYCIAEDENTFVHWVCSRIK